MVASFGLTSFIDLALALDFVQLSQAIVRLPRIFKLRLNSVLFILHDVNLVMALFAIQ